MAKKIKIELDFDIGDFAILIHDPEKLPRMVTEIRLLPAGLAIYTLVHADCEVVDCYAIELEDVKKVAE